MLHGILCCMAYVVPCLSFGVWRMVDGTEINNSNKLWYLRLSSIIFYYHRLLTWIIFYNKPKKSKRIAMTKNLNLEIVVLCSDCAVGNCVVSAIQGQIFHGI